jgi:hypothetical protein
MRCPNLICHGGGVRTKRRGVSDLGAFRGCGLPDGVHLRNAGTEASCLPAAPQKAVQCSIQALTGSFTTRGLGRLFP